MGQAQPPAPICLTDQAFWCGIATAANESTFLCIGTKRGPDWSGSNKNATIAHCVWNVGELPGPQKWAFNGANERPPDLGVDGSADDSRGVPRHPGCACLEYRIGGDFA